MIRMSPCGGNGGTSSDMDVIPRDKRKSWGRPRTHLRDYKCHIRISQEELGGCGWREGCLGYLAYALLPFYHSKLTWISGRKWKNGWKVEVLLVVTSIVGVEVPDVVVILLRQPVAVNLNHYITKTLSSQKL